MPFTGKDEDFHHIFNELIEKNYNTLLVLTIPRCAKAVRCSASERELQNVQVINILFLRNNINFNNRLFHIQTAHCTYLTFLQLGMASAMETLCGQAYGAKKYQMMGIYLQRSWIVLFLVAIILLPIYFFASSILLLIGQSPEIANQAGQVARWLIPLHFSYVLLLPQQRFLQCQQRNLVNAATCVIAFLFHVFISWLFMQKFRMGLVTAALTLDVSWCIVVLAQLGYIVLGGCPNTWKGFSMEAFSDLWEFLKLSVASGVMLWSLSLSLSQCTSCESINY